MKCSIKFPYQIYWMHIYLITIWIWECISLQLPLKPAHFFRILFYSRHFFNFNHWTMKKRTESNARIPKQNNDVQKKTIAYNSIRNLDSHIITVYLFVFSFLPLSTHSSFSIRSGQWHRHIQNSLHFLFCSWSFVNFR